MGRAKISQEEILLRCKLARGSRYDYRKLKYTGGQNKIEIVCSLHGSFWQEVSNHVAGQQCPKCAKGYKRTESELIEDFLLIHGTRYDYSNVVFKNTCTRINIICKEHGEFQQTPKAHLSGSGCHTCGKQRAGWSYTAWNAQAKVSKEFDSFKVYIIRCYNDKESFLKIGRTFTSIRRRFYGRLPYNYEILKVFEGEYRRMAELEVKLQNLNKEFKWKPLVAFRGENECFSELKESTFANYK